MGKVNSSFQSHGFNLLKTEMIENNLQLKLS